MDGQIIRQSSSYRQGLVLGLTMAEIMLLLIFCLLIALAAYLRLEHAKTLAAEAERTQQEVSPADQSVLTAMKRNPSLYERARSLSQLSDSHAVDQFWRDLVTDQPQAEEYRSLGLTAQQIHDRISVSETLAARGIDLTTALRDADVVGSIQGLVPVTNGQPVSTQNILEILQRGLSPENHAGHQWPPIISLSEANGHFFKTGSAELESDFRLDLLTKTPEQILQLIKEYDVDIIEVVGHTDEQPISARSSNLDKDLLPVLKNETAVGTLVPADNAGLGLARAVSVVSVLRQSKLLEGYRLIPLSGAQLVNTDETLAITGMPGDVRERRRIEIRLRKSSVHDASAGIPLPRARPVLVPHVKPPHPNPVVAPNQFWAPR